MKDGRRRGEQEEGKEKRCDRRNIFSQAPFQRHGSQSWSIVRRLSAGEARDLASATKKAKERRRRKRRNNNEKRIARRENGLGSLSVRPMKRESLG